MQMMTPDGEPSAITVKIDDISLRDEWQVRERLNSNTVRDYARGYAQSADFPPVKVASVNGALVLVDGWHRIAALRSLDREEVQAVVVANDAEEGRWLSAKANLANGLPLKAKERRAVFRIYVKTGQHRQGRRLKSYREMTRDFPGLASKSTLARWMQADFPSIAAQMAIDRDAGQASSKYDDEEQDPERVASKQLQQALKLALAEARGIACEVRRKALAAELEAVAREIVAVAPVSLDPDDNDDF